MEIAFELEAKDLNAFYRCANVSAWGLLAFESLVVVVGLMAIDWFFLRTEPLIAAVVNVAGISFYVYGRWRKRHEVHDRYVRTLADTRQSLIGRHVLKMSPDGYEHAVGAGRVVWRWAEVKRVVETDEYIFVRVGAAGATIIPKRAIPDASQLKWLRERLQSASRG
jgi:hypothetical protein